MKRGFIGLICTVFFFALPAYCQQDSGVSIIQLIANPKEYDGKQVRIIGFVRLEFEGNAIYLHHDDYKYRIAKNGLWIFTTEKIEKNRQEFNDKYVLIEGIFNAKSRGHFGMFSGSIQKITRIEVWSEIDGRR